jgi:uncharacterized membrane protein YdjX (TVP38/TMEM64 family)
MEQRPENGLAANSPATSAPPPPRHSRRTLRLLLFVLIAAVVVAIGFALAPHLSRHKVEGWARGAGPWGPLVLLGIQAGQILAAPIPGIFVPVLAGLLYGPVVGPLVTVGGTILGSIGAYWIGRTGGRPLAERLIGRQPIEKARGLFAGRRWMALVPLFVFPFSPADALCFVAGIVEMDWGRFLLAVAIGRIPKDALLAAAAGLGWKAFGS